MEAKYYSESPLNNSLIKNFDFELWENIQQKIQIGQNAYLIWKKMPFSERAACFKKTASLLRERTRYYATVITQEMGKPLSQSIAEVNKCALVCDYYAKEAESFLADRAIKEAGFVSYEPLGLILQIMPWNFPFWQVFRFAAPALMAGNTTILKHAPNVPEAALALEQLFLDAGFPVGVFQNVFAQISDLTKIMEHPHIKGVALTGSVRAGTSVGALAGANIKPFVLELGGSDAFIVLPDADLAQAAKLGVQSRFGNNGQTCIAAKRFIVHKSIQQQFLDLLKAEIALLKIGDPMDETVQISVMARPDLVAELQAQVDKSVEMGAVVELEGGRQGDSNRFLPMILSNIQPEMPAYSEELFGPVLSFFTFNTIEEAIALANDTVFGLGAAIWAKDIVEAVSIARQLEVGTVAINNLVRSAPDTPFGGIKQSGVGRELGREGILSFVNMKSIVV